MIKKNFFFLLFGSRLLADFAETGKTNTNTNIKGVKLLVIGCTILAVSQRSDPNFPTVLHWFSI
jgi:hypothetical protein